MLQTHKLHEVEQWPLSRLIEFAGNPRKNDHAVDAAAKAIKQFGFRVPILAKSDGMIIDGYLRLKAARQLGLATVPVLLADDLTDVQIKAFRLSVNKIADLAEWDADLLAFELDGLRDMEFDLSTIGFAPGELNDLIGTPNTGPLDTSPQLTDGFKFSVIVGAKDEADQARLLERFEAEGLRCRPLITQ